MFTDFGRISRSFLSDSTADCCLLDQEQQRVTDDIQQVGVLAQKAQQHSPVLQDR